MTVRDAVNKAFDRIGTSNGHALPQGADNYVEPMLHEFYVASELNSRARKRYDAAKKALIDSGEFDPATVQPGDQVQLLSSAHYALNLKVNNPTTRTDVKKFMVELAKAGVAKDVVDAAYKSATTPATPAKNYTVVPF